MEGNISQKPIYNIDLFEGVKEQFEIDRKLNKPESIYLKFYNENTKKQNEAEEEIYMGRQFGNQFEKLNKNKYELEHLDEIK